MNRPREKVPGLDLGKEGGPIMDFRPVSLERQNRNEIPSAGPVKRMFCTNLFSF